jgi:hypothetical protein
MVPYMVWPYHGTMVAANGTHVYQWYVPYGHNSHHSAVGKSTQESADDVTSGGHVHACYHGTIWYSSIAILEYTYHGTRVPW